MKKLFIIISLLSIFNAFSSFAGTDTEERRSCLIKTISLLDDYEYYSVINDEDTKTGFRSLFINDSAEIFNDLLGLSDVDVLTVKDYINIMSTQTRIPTIKLKNIKKESVQKMNGIWKVICTLEKEMSYTDICGVLLSSKEYFKADYTLRVYMNYYPESDKCVIEKIEGNVPGRRLTRDYNAIQSSKENAKYDKEVKYDGKTLSFNSYYQSILSEPFDTKKLQYRDPDVMVAPVLNRDCPKLVSLTYKPLRFRLKLHYDFGLGNAFKIDGSSAVTNSSSSGNFGLDFGYIIPSKSKIKVGIFVGVGLANSTINLGYTDADYTYSTITDVDGDSYMRHYQNLSISQKLKLRDLTVPVYLDFDFKLGKSISLFADLGAKMNLNLSSKVDNVDGTANVYGIYPSYGNLVIDGSSDEFRGYNGFGNINFSSENLKETKTPGTNKITVDGLLGVGIRYSIPSVPLVVELGAQYTMGFMDIIKNSDKVVVGGDQVYSDAIVYNEISGRNSKEFVHSLSETASHIKRQGMRLSLGLTYKF